MYAGQNGVQTHTVQMPQLALVNPVNESNVNAASVVTAISLTNNAAENPDGKNIGYSIINVGNLKLTDYEQLTGISSVPTATDSLNSAIGKLSYILNNSATTVDSRITTAIEALDSSYTATGATAETGITSTSTTNVISKVDIVDGKVTSTGSVSTLVDAAGAAAAAKTEVIGENTDTKTADTVYGAKAFATDAADTAETTAKDYADGVAATAEQNAKDFVSTTTFTYTKREENPAYIDDPEDPDYDPDVPQFIETSTTKTIEEWITYFMEHLSE